MKLDKKEVKKNVEELGLEFDFEMDKISEIYDIVTIGNQILRNENKDVDITKKETLELIINMTNSLYYHYGCGIAAPQVGKNLNLFIVKVEPVDEEEIPEKQREYFTDIPLTVFINPKIIKYSEDTNLDYEGCLSVPGFDAVVKRSNSIVIEYTNIFGEKCIEEYTGFVARAIQHEYDHLQGIVYTDIADMKTFTTRDNLIEANEEKES